MKKTIVTLILLFPLCFIKAQTPDNTNPGSTSPNNSGVQQNPVPSSTIPSTLPNNTSPNPVGTGGTDMTNPNNNGSYESNPDGKPRDNFQSTPNATPTNTRQPQTKTINSIK